MKALAILFGGFVVWMVVLTVGLASALSGSGGLTSVGSFDDTAGLGLDPEQIRNATISLSAADERQAPPLAVLSMMVSALGESDLRVVPNAAGSGYCGVFQAHPSNIACDDTKSQAEHFLDGGLGFQAGGAIHLAKTQPELTPGTIATMVEASGQPGSFYDAHRARADSIIAAWRAGGSLEAPALDLPNVHERLTPKQVVDQLILPIARDVGIQVTARDVEEANARHSTSTTSGNVSEHKGPPEVAWAADISDNWVSNVGSPKMTELAESLSKTFGIPWEGHGLVNHEQRVGPCTFRFQMIYLTSEGGDHFNHVHIGVHVVSC